MTEPRIWLGRTGQLETCRACGASFMLVTGESTSSLVHRYTAWREEHAPAAETTDDQQTAASGD